MTLLPEVRPETQRPARLAPDERPALSRVLVHLARLAAPASARPAQHPAQGTARNGAMHRRPRLRPEDERAPSRRFAANERPAVPRALTSLPMPAAPARATPTDPPRRGTAR